MSILFKKIEVRVTSQVDSFGIWAVALFLNTIMQELLVRGYLFEVLKNQYNSLIAITFITALFTLLHGGAFEAGIISILNVISMSIFMPVIFIETKSLVAPIIIHFIWNFTGGLIFDLISLAEDYPTWFSTKKSFFVDKNFGIEGSTFVLLINILFIVFFCFMIRRKRSIVHY